MAAVWKPSEWARVQIHLSHFSSKLVQKCKPPSTIPWGQVILWILDSKGNTAPIYIFRIPYQGWLVYSLVVFRESTKPFLSREITGLITACFQFCLLCFIIRHCCFELTVPQQCKLHFGYFCSLKIDTFVLFLMSTLFSEFYNELTQISTWARMLSYKSEKQLSVEINIFLLGKWLLGQMQPSSDSYDVCWVDTSIN